MVEIWWCGGVVEIWRCSVVRKGITRRHVKGVREGVGGSKGKKLKVWLDVSSTEAEY